LVSFFYTMYVSLLFSDLCLFVRSFDQCESLGEYQSKVDAFSFRNKPKTPNTQATLSAAQQVCLLIELIPLDSQSIIHFYCLRRISATSIFFVCWRTLSDR
jgi:hypothetical protein